MTATLIERSEAVTRIGQHITAREHYLITTPPGRALDFLDRLDVEWVAYADTGAPLVLITDEPAPVRITAHLVPLALVVAIPKTAPRESLDRAFVDGFSGSDTHDLVAITEPDSTVTYWPRLFIDALDSVDPISAAQMRAQAIRP